MNNDLILKPEYNFLEGNKHLGNNIILLGLSGSRAYGTHIETDEYISDYDLRGIALNTKEEILTYTDFEQVENHSTDTCIYSFNKFLNLLLSNSPNTIELLGLRDEDYLYVHPVAREIINNKEMFLSKDLIGAFAGYIDRQTKEIENYMARDKYAQYKTEGHIFNSMMNTLRASINRYTPFNCTNGEAIIERLATNKNIENSVKSVNKSFERLFSHFDTENELKLYLDESNREGLEVEIFGDFNLKHFPLRDFFNIHQDLSNVIRQYEKNLRRASDKKQVKDELHVNKHAMHTVRAYYMVFDILESNKIKTYRDQEHDLLMDIRTGKYMNKDGVLIPEYYEMLDELKSVLIMI